VGFAPAKALAENHTVDLVPATQYEDGSPLNLALVGGLRGAARMALAKSMLPKWNAEQSLGLICMAIAASNALTSDPTFTHALASQSIAQEIAVAVGHFAIRRRVTDELRGKLDLAIATIPRSDAFGFRAAQKKISATLSPNLYYLSMLRWIFYNEDGTEELAKAVASMRSCTGSALAQAFLCEDIARFVNVNQAAPVPYCFVVEIMWLFSAASHL
jgi:hypothetical protein